MFYLVLLAIFLPFGLMFNHFDQHEQDLEEGHLQSSLFYVDQMRQLLPVYLQKNPNHGEGEVTWNELFSEESSGGFKLQLAERKDIKQYVDAKGFYLVWEKPKSGMANRLLEHYSRPGGQGSQLIFYHIGFTEEKEGHLCLTPIRSYQYPDLSKVTCAWPLPKIKEGALVLTDREPQG